MLACSHAHNSTLVSLPQINFISSSITLKSANRYESQQSLVQISQLTQGLSKSRRNMMLLHEYYSNEKQVSSLMVKIFHLHLGKKEHQI